MMYPTLMFRVGDVDAAAAGDAWRTIPERMKQAQEAVNTVSRATAPSCGR